LLGEHNAEVYGKLLRLDDAEIEIPRGMRAPRRASSGQ